jgi:WD and tetratricopeptide repeat-containing protein 1
MSVSYFPLGHLPQKQDHYKEKFRSLVSTYVTFSPDGCDLLANLGGEQIYLFDINKPQAVQRFDLFHKLHSNGIKGEHLYLFTW